MKAHKRRNSLIVAGVVLMNSLVAQKAVPLEIFSSMPQLNGTDSNMLQYAVHKTLPPGYEAEALEALAHFPELKNIPIKFKVKKSFSTLKTRPDFLSMLMPRGHRKYIITISNKTINKLTPLMFVHLSEAARIGVVGHELSHVVDLSGKSTWQCLKTGIGHLSARFLDRFEYHTDMICIQHGLGDDLKAWSSYIRDTMHTRFWRGAGYAKKGDTRYERYMNPATIDNNMPGGIQRQP